MDDQDYSRGFYDGALTVAAVFVGLLVVVSLYVVLFLN